MCGSRYNTEDSEIARMAKEIMEDYDQATTDFGAAVMTLPVLDGTKHALLGVIGRIKSIEGARAFAEPIDVDKYRDIVKHPMDLSTVERNLQSDQFVVPLLVLYCVYIVVAHVVRHNIQLLLGASFQCVEGLLMLTSVLVSFSPLLPGMPPSATFFETCNGYGTTAVASIRPTRLLSTCATTSRLHALTCSASGREVGNSRDHLKH